MCSALTQIRPGHRDDRFDRMFANRSAIAEATSGWRQSEPAGARLPFPGIGDERVGAPNISTHELVERHPDPACPRITVAAPRKIVASLPKVARYDERPPRPVRRSPPIPVVPRKRNRTDVDGLPCSSARSGTPMGRPEGEPLPGQPRRSDAPRRLIADTAAAAP